MIIKEFPPFGPLGLLGDLTYEANALFESSLETSLTSQDPKARVLQILIVDDNAFNRVLLQQLVQTFGHSVESVESGPEALAALEARSFDLVLLDCVMPGMDGFETARRIRVLSGANGRIPILALSGLDPGNHPERFANAGMDRAMMKPLDPDELHMAILDLAPPLPQLDRAHLIQLGRVSKDGEKLVEQLVAIYLLEAPQLWTGLREAWAKGDLRTVEFKAHTLCTVSAHLGFHQLAELCRRFEQQSGAGQSPEQKDILALERLFAAAQQGLIESWIAHD